MDEALPVLRRLWAGESVSHDGPSGSFTDVSSRQGRSRIPSTSGSEAMPRRPSIAAGGWVTGGSRLCARPRRRQRERRSSTTSRGAWACHQPRTFRDQRRLRAGRYRLQQRGGLRFGPASQGPSAGAAPPGGPGRVAGTPRILPRRRILQVHRPTHGGPRRMAPRARGARRRRGRSADVTATTADRRRAVLEFLRSHGAAGTPHIFGDLLTHLVGVETLCATGVAPTSWPSPPWAMPPTGPMVSSRASSNSATAELVDAIGADAEAPCTSTPPVIEVSSTPNWPLPTPGSTPSTSVTASPGPCPHSGAEICRALRRPHLRQRGRAGVRLAGRTDRMDLVG